MKKRRVILVVVGCLVLGSAAMLLWPREREPTYQGTALSEWLWRCIIYTNDVRHHPEAQEAADAVRHIGTNALPWLLKWMPHEMPAWKVRLVHAARSLPTSHARDLLVNALYSTPRKAVNNSTRALTGWYILGPLGSPAIPELTRLIKDRKTPIDIVTAAIFALFSVGKDALAPVLEAIRDPGGAHRDQLVWTFFVLRADELGTNGAAAVPVLARCLKDRDPNVAFAAARSLGALKLEPELAVPSLMQSLQDSDADLRSAAAESLGRFASEAHTAVPSLVNALKDTNALVWKAASNALYTIDPKALEKALGR
jgi:hypothetical protein